MLLVSAKSMNLSPLQITYRLTCDAIQEIYNHLGPPGCGMDGPMGLEGVTYRAWSSDSLDQKVAVKWFRKALVGAETQVSIQLTVHKIIHTKYAMLLYCFHLSSFPYANVLRTLYEFILLLKVFAWISWYVVCIDAGRLQFSDNLLSTATCHRL